MKIPLIPEAMALIAGTALVLRATAATDFAAEIEPLLIKRCSECHGPDKQKADLRLDSRAAALRRPSRARRRWCRASPRPVR